MLLTSLGFFITELVSGTAFNPLYSYGVSKFWVIYTPIAGWFAGMFYNEHACDGPWVVGSSDSVAVLKWLNDFLKKF